MSLYKYQAFWIIVFAASAGGAVAEILCGPGEYLVAAVEGRPERCQPCAPGHYQDKQNHRKDHCNECNVFDHYDPRLILKEECTRFHYWIVECIPGFYLFDHDCYTCTNCALHGKFQGHPCQKDQNTVCCDYEDMIVIDGRCQFRPIFCGIDQYLVPGSEGQRDECQPCQVGFFTREDRHRNTKCTERPVPTDPPHRSGTGEDNMTIPTAVMTLVMCFVVVYIVRKVIPRFRAS